MATKAKRKSKAAKKAPGRASAGTKTIRLKTKPAKSSASHGSTNGSKAPSKAAARRLVKSPAVESRRTPVAAAPTPTSHSSSPERVRARQFASAIEVYEAGIKAMHAEEFEKAIRHFNDLVAQHSDETEIQERAKVLLHACEKKIHERGRTVLRSADDHYNVGIADLNRRELASAIDHLHHALKLMPKGDHILYALATASALLGNRDDALTYLKQSIAFRGENRFLAARDSDFESLHDDPDFKHLVAPNEK